MQNYWPAVAPVPPALLKGIVDVRTRLRSDAPAQPLSVDEQTSWQAVLHRIAEVQLPAARAQTTQELLQHQQSGWIDSTEALRLLYRRDDVDGYRGQLQRWEQDGLLPPRAPYAPLEVNAVAALLIARTLVLEIRKRMSWPSTRDLDPTQAVWRGWAAEGPALDQADLTSWWCWSQERPSAPVQPLPVHRLAGLPAGALLWTPWVGAAWDGTWTAVSSGAVRWSAPPSAEALASWAASIGLEQAAEGEILVALGAVRLRDNLPRR